MPVGMYRFNGGKAARVLIKAQLVDEAGIIWVAEPLWTTLASGQFDCMLRW
jgi:hypothetical protein